MSESAYQAAFKLIGILEQKIATSPRDSVERTELLEMKSLLKDVVSGLVTPPTVVPPEPTETTFAKALQQAGKTTYTF